jgi:hypothetical protein
MRIVNREEFLKLQAGVLYQKYEHCVIDGNLSLKGETIKDREQKNIDWFYTDLSDNIEADNSNERIDILFEAADKGTAFKMDYFCGERDGMHKQEQLFIVYEKKDIESLMYFLVSTHNAYPKLPFKGNNADEGIV